PIQSVRLYDGRIQEIVSDVLRLQERGFTQFFVLPTVGKAERLTEILNEYEAPVVFFQRPDEDWTAGSDGPEARAPLTLRGKLVVSIGHLSAGFRNPEQELVLFTEDDLFGESRPIVRTAIKKSPGKFLSDLRDLKIQDY